MIGSLKYCGITRGWDDQKRYDGNQIVVSELADSFFSIILDIQQDRPDITALDIDVINNYVLSRSERRGYTTRFQADKVPEDVISWMNLWSIGE